MNGFPYDLPKNGEVHTIQNLNENKLKTLDEIPLFKAQEMMNSQEWTRAVFVREIKERILSAFMNKFVQDRSYFKNKRCHETILIDRSDRDECPKMVNTKNFAYF
jgi:hypothetical protein